MTRDQAIRKVLACLRLAKSSNPNEAAAALRQARALMDKFGLTETDAEAAEIANASAPTGYRGGMVPRSMLALANLIADCYRSEVIIERIVGYRGKSALRFFGAGAGADAQIAAYAFTVLYRQLREAKSKHLARVRKRANREARGEEFAFGWIYAVKALLPSEALPENRKLAIKRAVEIEHEGAELGTTTGKAIGKGERLEFCRRSDLQRIIAALEYDARRHPERSRTGYKPKPRA